jgi:hypothetical protein
LKHRKSILNYSEEEESVIKMGRGGESDKDGKRRRW